MKKRLIIFICISVVLALIVFIVPEHQQKSLKDAIASAVNVDASFLNLNLPPMPARLPGSILAPRNGSFMIYKEGKATNNDIIVGESFSIEASLQGAVTAKGFVGSNIISAAFDNDKDLNVSLKISDAHVLELPIPSLEDIVLDDNTVSNALKRGVNPSIVNRSYIGRVEYIIKAKNEKGLEALSELKDMGNEIAENSSRNFKLIDRFKTEKEIEFSIEKPIVFAFELLDINMLTAEFSPDDTLTRGYLPDDTLAGSYSTDEFNEISLTPVSPQRPQRAADQNSPTAPSQTENRESTKWGLIVISSAHYSHDAELNSPQSAEGSVVAEKIFEEYNPTFVKKLLSSSEKPLTDDMIMGWSTDLAADLSETPVDHLIIYYVGRGLTLPNGEIQLLQGNVNRDYTERAVEASAPKTSRESDGMMLVETLHSAIGASGIPFTLLIDACSPKDKIISGKISDIAHTLKTTGKRFPYRNETDAVIFSSKPGSAALYHENILNPYGVDLPPLASGLLKYSAFAPLENDEQNLADMISANIDWIDGIGEITVDGTVTWSNLETLQNTLKNIYRD